MSSRLSRFAAGKTAYLTVPLLAFLASVSFAVLLPHPQPYGDSPEYLSLASNVASGKGFTADGVSPYVYRPPLFSAALGLWFSVFGGPGLFSAALFQCFVFSLSALGVFLLALELLPRRRHAFWTALAFALHPMLLPFSVYVLQEPFLILTTTFALLFSVRLLKAPGYGGAAASGLSWGVCILGKAVALFAPALLALFLARRARGPALLMLGLAVLTVSPWTARNYSVTGKFIPVNDQGTGALEWYVMRGAHASAGGAWLPAILRAEKLPEAEYRKRLVSFILDHPALLAKQTAANALRFMQVDREWYGKVAGFSMRWQVWLLPFLVLQLPLYAGFLAALRPRMCAAELFLSTFYALYWLQYALYWGEPRFAVPVYPVLLCMGVSGWLYFSVRGKNVNS